ncbi:MAG: Re/Si-specific NAD(P)(+) transhydrogenase subunit alpha [Pyrinomonadaceae bacterium]
MSETVETVKDKEVQIPSQRKSVGIPKEKTQGEARVAATPETAAKLQKLGFDVYVESGAGALANFPDELYEQAGCTVFASEDELLKAVDIILKVSPPEAGEVMAMPPNKTLISFIFAAANPTLIQALSEKNATVISMDAIPRISRAQKMDALSSMANIAGYRAVLEAANSFGSFFTGQITAAGKVPPAKVLVIGAGVAGLSAIGAAQSLGAIVRAFDTRPEVAEQIESMGAEFLMLDFKEDGSGEGGYAKVMSKEFIDAEMALFAEQAKDVDIIITTALIPNKKAPLLITREMVESMKEGSVIVDLAAEQGGNCEVTKPNEAYKYGGVTVIGYTDLPSRMATQSSRLYGMNLCNLLSDMGGGEDYHVDYEDEVVRGALLLDKGEILPPPPKPEPSPAPVKKEEPVTTPAPKKKESSGAAGVIGIVCAAVLLIAIGVYAPETFLSHFTVFVLACFIGWQVIWNVTPALHTPLMSVTNAISGIIIIGGMLQLSSGLDSPTTILGAVAVLIGTINIAGGFLVTQRMLKMFQK